MGTGKDSSEATDDLDDMPLAERRSLIRLRKAASPLSRVPEPPKCFHSAFSAYASFYYFLGRVIEDMSIQVNVPALVMEEVAPLAVSDAAMLAPEEIFHGKGNIKEEAELTKEERKRRRVNQKRRFRRLKGTKVGIQWWGSTNEGGESPVKDAWDRSALAESSAGAWNKVLENSTCCLSLDLLPVACGPSDDAAGVCAPFQRRSFPSASSAAVRSGRPMMTELGPQ
ncbi:hypothetical protein ZIOFF_007890 [Zingiber officinale]|uniref:Uncharacterized protein n=1 Tax=Zingiber officinale TaxID=94328 RepID=A0A8J5I2E6_ZINOF|nr:hypothetical protein ZIOFF_007890 [Zingiber officinale]